MTINTLTYIHRLLIDNEAQMAQEAELARKARKEAMDAMEEALYNETPADTDLDDMSTIESVYKCAQKRWVAARAALDEFEARKW